nr:Uncharacterised protein [Klebsiella pneumoniae]
MRFIEFMLAFVNFVRIAFLPGFLQIALTFSDLFPLFGNFLLMIGFEFTVATVFPNLT